MESHEQLGGDLPELVDEEEQMARKLFLYPPRSFDRGTVRSAFVPPLACVQGLQAMPSWAYSLLSCPRNLRCTRLLLLDRRRRNEFRPSRLDSREASRTRPMLCAWCTEEYIAGAEMGGNARPGRLFVGPQPSSPVMVPPASSCLCSFETQ